MVPVRRRKQVPVAGVPLAVLDKSNKNKVIDFPPQRTSKVVAVFRMKAAPHSALPLHYWLFFPPKTGNP